MKGSERNNIAASGRTVFIRESVGKCTRQGAYYILSMSTRTGNYIYFIIVNTVDAAQNVAAPALRP